MRVRARGSVLCICIYIRVRYTCNHKNNHENQKQLGTRLAPTVNITCLVQDNHNVYIKGKPQQQQRQRQQRIR